MITHLDLRLDLSPSLTIHRPCLVCIVLKGIEGYLRAPLTLPSLDLSESMVILFSTIVKLIFNYSSQPRMYHAK